MLYLMGDAELLKGKNNGRFEWFLRSELTAVPVQGQGTYIQGTQPWRQSIAVQGSNLVHSIVVF